MRGKNIRCYAHTGRNLCLKNDSTNSNDRIMIGIPTRANTIFTAEGTIIEITTITESPYLNKYGIST